MKTITKCMALSALLMTATVAMIALPAEGTPMARWLALLVGSKALCGCLLVAAHRLHRRWSGTLGFFDKLTGKED